MVREARITQIILLIAIALAFTLHFYETRSEKNAKDRLVQERRIIEMDYQMKLYQYNQTFCKSKNWSETLKQVDSMIVLQRQNLEKSH